MVEKHIIAPVLTKKQSNSDGYEREFGEFPTQSGDTLIPVSYTHLDVYKRQVQQRTKPFFQRIWLPILPRI